MQNTIRYLIIMSFACIIGFLSCKKEISKKRGPIANAGPDQLIALPTDSVFLDGSASIDPDGMITNYLWTRIPSFFSVSPVITAKAEFRTVVKNLEPGTYKFVLKVTDNDGFIDFDTMAVTVLSSSNTRWRRLSSPPICGQSHILGIYPDKLFLYESAFPRFYEYNIRLDSWNQKLNLPFPLGEPHHHVVNFSVNGNVYSGLGFKKSNGLTGGSLPINEIFCYDPLTDIWTQKNKSPISGAATALVIDDFVLLLQGQSVWRYDPATDTYTQKSIFPGYLPLVNNILFSDSAIVSFAINGEGYILSGSNCWKYNAGVDRWQQKSSLPTNTYAQGGFSLNNFGYVLIDSNSASSRNMKPLQFWQYNPLQDEWLRIYDDYPGQGEFLVKTATVNGTVYVGFGYHINNDGLGCDFWKFQ